MAMHSMLAASSIVLATQTRLPMIDSVLASASDTSLFLERWRSILSTHSRAPTNTFLSCPLILSSAPFLFTSKTRAMAYISSRFPITSLRFFLARKLVARQAAYRIWGYLSAMFLASASGVAGKRYTSFQFSSGTHRCISALMQRVRSSSVAFTAHRTEVSDGTTPLVRARGIWFALWSVSVLMAPHALTRRRWEVCSKSVSTERRSARDGSGSRRFDNSFFWSLEWRVSSSGRSSAAAAEATDWDSLFSLSTERGVCLDGFLPERGVVGGRDEDDGVPPPLDFRDDDARGVERVGDVGVGCLLLSLSSRLSREFVLTRGGAGGDLSLFPALRDRCFILDGLMTFSRVIGEEAAAAAADSDVVLIPLERTLLGLSSKVKFLL
mmetsp:Transcript_20963/g.44857  ORF Transcript_20963/g.44857 Transcript_20963/m.44857 type:complete len:382 (+) Transcript_20963:955-2100(+)